MPHAVTVLRRGIGRALSLLALATVALPGIAAAQETTGGIRGTVTAGEAAAAAGAAGVQVTAVNAETGLTRTVVTLEDGSYTIRLLPPGTYTVSARRIGLRQQQRAGVRVSVGSVVTANFALSEAAAELAAVTVTGATPVDVTDGGVKQSVSTEEIQNLPTLGRDFTDFISLSGLVSPTPEVTTGGQFSIGGARPSQTNIQLDGVDANNAFFGENRGGSRIPFNFSIESVKEFQIITNGFDVEYGNYAGGVINIVSRGGSNRFRGTAYTNYRGDALTAENFNGTQPNNFIAQQFAAQVEGPLVKDRLFYLVSLDAQRRREPFVPNGPVALRRNATQLEAQADAATDPTVEAELRADALAERTTADSLERFFSILSTRYGVANPAAAYDEFEVSNDVATLFARVDWNINERHRLSLRNNWSNYNNANETFSGTFIGGLSQAEAFKNRTNSFVGELTSTLGARTANVFRVQVSGEARPRVGNNLLPQLRVNNVTPGEAYAWGGNSIAFRNSLNEDKVQVINNTTIDLGRHVLKFGTNNTFARYDNRFWLQGSGFYTFNTLEDLENYSPLLYTRNVRADGSDPGAKFGTEEYAFYVQDQWQVTPRLLATIGLRYDYARFSDNPGRVYDVERAFDIETGIAPEDRNNVAPRVSLAWDRLGNGTEVVRAGFGISYGRLPAVLGSNVAATDIPLLNLTCNGSAAEGDPDAPPLVSDYQNWAANGDDNPVNCASAGGIGGIPEYSFWTRGFEIPETYRANLGYERAITRNTTVSADYLYTLTTNLYTVRNLNLRAPVFSLANEGGRLVFVPEASFNPATSAGNDRLVNTTFGNVFQNFYDGRALSHILTFGVTHNFDNGSNLRASYTWTKAEDNSDFTCCTSFAGWSDTRIGAAGPNDIGGVGDESRAWGPSVFSRDHVVVLSGYTALPWGFKLSGVWRWQSGVPWSPEQGGDLNGDGLSFNDRPFIFEPDQLPVNVPTSITDPAERTQYIADRRAVYAGYLADNACVREHVGSIIPRGACRQPSFNRLDLSLRNRFPTRDGQAVEISLDFFNVLNGLNKDWGRYESVSTSRRNLISPAGYDAGTQQILYNVNNTFGDRTPLGANLLLQFSTQLGIRYIF